MVKTTRTAAQEHGAERCPVSKSAAIVALLSRPN